MFKLFENCNRQKAYRDYTMGTVPTRTPAKNGESIISPGKQGACEKGARNRSPMIWIWDDCRLPRNERRLFIIRPANSSFHQFMPIPKRPEATFRSAPALRADASPADDRRFFCSLFSPTARYFGRAGKNRNESRRFETPEIASIFRLARKRETNSSETRKSALSHAFLSPRGSFLQLRQMRGGKCNSRCAPEKRSLLLNLSM